MPASAQDTPTPPSGPLINDPSDRRQLASRVLVVVILTAAVTLERIDIALAGAHEAGAISGGFGDIATPASMLEPAGAVSITIGWRALKELAGPLIWAYGGVDLLLMLALAVWLGWLHRGRGASSTSGDTFTWILRPIGLALWPIHWVRITRQRVVDGGWRTFLPAPSFGLMVCLYLLADFAEDAAVIYLWHTIPSAAVPPVDPEPLAQAQVIGALSLAKWIFLGTSILILVLHYRSSTTQGSMPAVRQLGRAILALRGQLAVSIGLAAILLALRGDLGRQVDDVLTVAASRPWPSATIATITAAIASIILTVGGISCLRAYKKPPRLPRGHGGAMPARRRAHRWIALGLTIACVTLLAIGVNISSDRRAAMFGLAILCGIIGLAFVPAWFRETRLPTTRAWYERPADQNALGTVTLDLPNWMIPVVADLPMLALFLAIIRASVTTWAAGSSPSALLVWAALVAVLWLNVHCVALAWTGERWHLNKRIRKMRWYWPLGLGFALLATFAFAPQREDHWIRFYQWLGTPAVLMLFASTLGLITTGATLLSDQFRPGGLLDAVKVHRLPIFSVVIAWGLFASVVDVAGAYYVVRTEEGRPDRPSVSRAFNTWIEARPAENQKATSKEAPLVFVAAAGGGIRAAYWTRLGMDCVFGTACGNPQDNTGQVFLASGVSGGSLGLVSTRSRQTSGASAAQSIDAVLGEDFIAPSLAAFLFVDQPNAFLRLPLHGVNRADMLERAWEHADSGLAESFGVGDTFPKLVLNSTSVEDGCRLEISEVTIDPSTRGQRDCEGAIGDLTREKGPGSTPTRDAFAHLCDGDEQTPAGLALSTAALMSARFPYVSPAGGLRGCTGKARTFALDGGIVDNSGGTAVLEALQQVTDGLTTHNIGVRKKPKTKPTSAVCIVPKLVVFDSGQVAGIPPQADNRPLQFTAPLVAALGGFDRRSSTPIAQAALAIHKSANAARDACGLPQKLSSDADVVVISPNEQPSPGIPLGWTLSSESRKQMRCQMGGSQLVPDDLGNCADSSRDDMDDVKKVWDWFATKAA